MTTVFPCLLHTFYISAPFKVCGITASTDDSGLKPGQVAVWQPMQQKLLPPETAKLNLGEDTDDSDDPEADLEEDEAVILNMTKQAQRLLATILCAHKLKLYMKATGHMIFEPIDCALDLPVLLHGMLRF